MKKFYIYVILFVGLYNINTQCSYPADEIFVIFDYTQPIKKIRVSFKPLNFQEPRFILTISKDKDKETKVLQKGICNFQNRSCNKTPCFYTLETIDLESAESKQNRYIAKVLSNLESALEKSKMNAKQEYLLEDGAYSLWDASSKYTAHLLVESAILTKAKKVHN